METAVLYALIASSALPLGAWLGANFDLSPRITAAALAFASGALISAIAFELFGVAVEHGGAWRSGAAFFAGATVFIVVDTWLDRYIERQKRRAGSAIGFAVLAAVTLDGLPENVAMGVGLIESAGTALLVAIFASNLPEAIVGAKKMREAGLNRGRVMLIWGVTAIVLAAAVVIGYAGFGEIDHRDLAWPLGFAAGAVLASLADTLMPEAFEEAKRDPRVAYFTALGFLLAYLISEG